MRKSFWLLLLSFPSLLSGLAQAERPGSLLLLRNDWTLESGCSLKSDGEEISSKQYQTQHAYHISVPSTVLAAQVASGEYRDPYFDMNLRKIPGTTYPIGENFSNLPMDANSPYHCPWWYRKQFPLRVSDEGRTLTLHFGGINYRANIWLNGKLIADSNQIAGAYRTFDLDITRFAHSGQSNVLAVETYAPTPTDLGVNWVDWSPCPPDKDMGLTGPVNLLSTGPVTITSPMVSTHFADRTLDEAQLTIFGELDNNSGHQIRGDVTATLLGMSIRQNISLAAGEKRSISFTPDQYKNLNVKHPAVWWPYAMGTPHLHELAMRFTVGGKLSDQKAVRFGIREITSELIAPKTRLFRVNGKPILIRGGGWSQDMMLRENPERLRKEFALVRDLNLNTIRLEGKLETEDFFKLADEQGILVMAGWCCCDQWEHWDKWTPENHAVAAASLRSQMLRLRHHASLLVWLNGSDNPPPAEVEQTYLDIEKEMHWPNPAISSASATPTSVTGNSGVKMTGPYDFVAPSYWMVDTYRHGGAFSFNTETSPGPAIPSVYSLRKFLPADQLWPLNDDWAFHNGGEGFQKLTVFNDAMRATYGTPQSLYDYERMAQAMAYDGERAMFEAYSRNKYTSTGVIQWMLNNAWPSTIWHLFDYYLDSGGGYFGAKKALEPVHIQYSYDDHSIYVVNSTYEPLSKLHTVARVYDLKLKPLYAGDADIASEADASTKALVIPESTFTSGSQIYFIQLSLGTTKGEIISDNFYWIPAALTSFDWAKTDYTHTPALNYERMTDLRSLPQAVVTPAIVPSKDGSAVRLRLLNSSHALALQVALRALDAKGTAIEPVFWSDNYVSLMPGEERTISAKLWSGSSDVASVVISGWNVRQVVLNANGKKPAPDK